MASGMFEGTYRLEHRDANDNVVAELLEKLYSEFGITEGATGTEATYVSDPNKLPKIKKHLSTVMRQDDKLVVRVKSIASRAVDVDDDGHDIRIPVTFRNNRTGVVYEKTLGYADFTDNIAADTTLAAGVWYDWMYYAIPAQSEMKLGHSIQDARVDSAIHLGWDPDITD